MQKEKKTQEKKKKLIATVMEVTHGRFLNKHKHYDIKLIQVSDDITVEQIEKAAIRATDMAKKIGIRVRLLAAEEVEITTREMMKDKVHKFLSDN